MAPNQSIVLKSPSMGLDKSEPRFEQRNDERTSKPTLKAEQQTFKTMGNVN